MFKFHRTVKLEPGAIATVWSADAGVDHDPPRDIVMKGQKWFVADSFTTTLLNNDQEVILFRLLYFSVLNRSKGFFFSI